MNTKYKSIYFCLISLLVFSGTVFSGTIVPDYNDSDAAFDITDVSDNDDGINAPDNTTGSVTFAAKFALAQSDIANSANGPVVIFENGGTSNGNGIYLSDGKFMFFIKNNSRFGVPSGVGDTDLTDGAALLNLAPAAAGEYTAYVSFDANAGIVVSNINNIVKIFNLTVPASVNIQGNRTVTFLGLNPGGDVPNDGSLGGLCEYEGDEANPNFNPLWDWHHCVNVSEQTGDIRAQLFYAAIDPVKYPSTPSPADNATLVDPATVTELSFYTGKDPANPTAPNPDITGHYVTIYDVFEGEPNFAEPAIMETFVAAGTDPISFPYTFALDDVVCWQIEEQVSGAAKGSSSNIAGPQWKFEALPSIPVVSSSPEDTLGYAGGSVELVCAITSKSAATVAWYKQGQVDPLGSDPDVTIETVNDSEFYISTMTIANFEATDQGEYYCTVANASGNAVSGNAQLGVKRLLAHWKLDTLTTGTTYNYYEDLVGGYHADPNEDPAPEQFVDGVDPAKTGSSLDLTANGQTSADSGNWAPSLHTGEVSVCAWIYWEGITSWQGVVSNRITTGGSESNFWIEIRPDGYLQIGGPNFTALVAEPLPVDEWIHLAVTAGGDGMVIYYNGIPVATSTTAVDIQQLEEVDLNIGALDRNVDNSFASTLNGKLDEVKIFSYALSHTEVVDDYYPVSEIPVCVNPDGVSLIMDANSDCEVNILDFAIFSGDWLNCEYYPVCMY